MDEYIYRLLSVLCFRYIFRNITRIKDYFDLQFIARALERVGDYSKNICEDAIFVESAVDIRHGGVLSHEDN